MRRVGLAFAGLLIGAAPALAQYGPRPPALIGPMAADDVSEIVHAMGLDPMGAPARSGAFYVQRAVDDYGRVLRVTVDARRSQVIAIEAEGTLRGGYGYQPYGRPYRGYAALPSYDHLAPPGSAMAPHGQPPVAAPHGQPQLPAPSAARPAAKSAAVAPQRTPVPRRRPAGAPEQASGSVEPAPTPQNAAAAPAQSAPAAAPAKLEPALPPVAPLE